MHRFAQTEKPRRLAGSIHTGANYFSMLGRCWQGRRAAPTTCVPAHLRGRVSNCGHPSLLAIPRAILGLPAWGRGTSGDKPSREPLVLDLAPYALLAFSCLALVYSLSG